MVVYINSKAEKVPDEVKTVGQLLDLKNIARKGTGLAVNGKLLKVGDWDSAPLNPEDHLMVITATFGG